MPAYEVALDVEKAVFSKVGNGQTNGDYKAKIRSLSLNLKDKNNPDLRRSVLDGQIEPERLVVMTPEEMASDARKAERQRLQAQNLFNARAAEPQEAETDMFECSRCHQRKVRYFEKQTRSADEPMTGMPLNSQSETTLTLDLVFAHQYSAHAPSATSGTLTQSFLRLSSPY